MMKRWLVIAALVIVPIELAMVMVMAAEGPDKVPDDVAVQILKLQREEVGAQNDMLRMQQQYLSDQQLVAADDQKLLKLKQDALAEGKKDDTWDVDLNTLTFIPKPKPAEEKKTDAPAK